jgi:hypothetical protein
MRKLCGSILLSLLVIVTSAQTSEHRVGISVGGGPQDYLSSFGNGFKFSSPGWHGAGDLYVGTAINPSFDIVFFGSIGDLGSNRMKALGMLLKYKFANEYLLPESSTLKPYVYAGIGYNNLVARVKVKPIYDANFMSLNGGLGLRYYVFKSIHIGYNLSFGYFIGKGDPKAAGNPTEMLIHNAILLGVDLF